MSDVEEAESKQPEALAESEVSDNPVLPVQHDVEEALPCDDDMSDETEAAREAEVRDEPSPNAGRVVPVALATPRRRSVATKVADCKARLAELQALKTQKLEEEDYMGAHEAKQMILEQEQMLQALRVEGTPTPSNAPAGSDPRWCPSEERPESMELHGLEGKPFTLPNDVFDRLYGYQREGVAWMAKLMSRQHGGVLADEMGLGKTIQVCALLNGARKAGKTHALLLMPVTLLEQWSREAKSWCPGWPVYTYYGTMGQRAKALRGIRRPMGGLLLTSYSLAINCEELLQVRVEDTPEPTRRRGRPPGAQPSKRRKLDDDDGEGEAVESEEEIEPELPGGGEGLPEIGSTRAWDLVICDEAHRMKNMSSLLAKSLRGLKSKCRILLTGTPVQNALQDLWALMDFAQPGLLGNHATFVKTFSEPIDRGSVRGAKVWAVELKKHLAEQLRALINPHLLRRTKTSAGIMGDGEIDGSGEDVEMEDSTPVKDVEGVVKKLPSKKETIVWLYPSEEQEAMYKKVLEQSEVIREACNKSKLGIEVFRAIGLLKRLCNHPLLLLQMPKVKDWAELLKEVQAQETGTEAEKEPSEAEPEQVWDAFCGAVGDCQDLRVLSSLPASMVAEATTVSRLEDGRRFTPVEAIQVGLVYRASHLLVHLAAGGNMGTWADPNPWTTPSSMQSSGARDPSSPGASGATGVERKMKLSQVADQGDESEFPILPESQKAEFYSKYVSKVGGMPADSEDPTVEQLSAIVRKVRTLHQPPYCDFAVFVPFAKRHLRAQKYQSFVLQEDGSFMAKMVPGPSCFTHWQRCFRVLRTALVMTDIISLANLMEWESLIERLSRQYPNCWGLIASAEDRGRGEFMSRTLARLRLEMEQGGSVPLGWNEEQPWDVVWSKVLRDRDFWHENVHTPAIAWTARGSRGKAMTPIEEWAESAMQGGKRALGLDQEEGEQDPRRRTKVRREARKKRQRAEKEELQSYRRNSKGGGGKGSGATGAKGGSANLEEECYAWNNGNGL
eukprot:s1151_g28.t1